MFACLLSLLSIKRLGEEYLANKAPAQDSEEAVLQITSCAATGTWECCTATLCSSWNSQRWGDAASAPVSAHMDLSFLGHTSVLQKSFSVTV